MSRTVSFMLLAFISYSYTYLLRFHNWKNHRIVWGIEEGKNAFWVKCYQPCLLRAERGEGSAFIWMMSMVCVTTKSNVKTRVHVYTYEEAIHTTNLLGSCAAHAELEGHHLSILSIPCMLWRKVVKDIVTYVWMKRIYKIKLYLYFIT